MSATPEDLWREATRAHQAGDLPRAVAHYRHFLGLLPPGLPATAGVAALAHFNLGVASAALGETAAARQAYEAALALQPDLHTARLNLGSVWLAEGEARRALDCFRAVAAAWPAAPRIAYNEGVALQTLGDDAAACAAFERALLAEPGHLEALNNLCVSLLRLGRAADALAVCDRQLALAPVQRKPLAYRAAALLELGRRDEAALLLDFPRLVRRHELPAPAGFGSLAAFNAALAAHVRAHPSLRFEPPDRSTRGGSQTGELLVGEQGPCAALATAIRAAVTGYLAELPARAPDHPYASQVPARWRLATWAVVLAAQGHQGPHFHPSGFLSGVYYVSLPPDMQRASPDAGALEFGRTEEAVGGRAEPLIHLVQPAEGSLLLFPSYFYHRTLPFESTAERISIAFDVIPA